MNRFEIITKLAAVEAIEGQGATAGERQAATEARLRLEERLLGEPIPLPSAFAEEMAAGAHLRSLADDEPAADDRVQIPSRGELLQRVVACAEGRLPGAMLTRWAAACADAVILPDLDPDHPGSVVPEVILVLATGPPSATVAQAMIRFLESPAEATAAGWRIWLEDLAAAS